MPEECLKEGNASHFLARAIPLCVPSKLKKFSQLTFIQTKRPPFFVQLVSNKLVLGRDHLQLLGLGIWAASHPRLVV